MGFFSDLFGSKNSQPSTSTVITSNKLPAFMERGGEENFEIAKQLGARDYPLYEGPRLAAFTPDQQAGFNVVRSNVGSYQPAQTAGEELTYGAASTNFPDANLSAYMNPYIQQAIDPALRELRRNADIARNKQNAALARRKSYGFDRHALMENEINRNENLAAGDLLASGYDRAFQNAVGAFNADRSAQMAGGGQLAALGQQRQQMGYADAAALGDIGAQQKAHVQEAVNIPYTEFLRQYYHPIEQLNLRASILSGTPYGATVNQQVPFMTPNTGAQGIGALAALAGGAGQLYESGIFG